MAAQAQSLPALEHTTKSAAPDPASREWSLGYCHNTARALELADARVPASPQMHDCMQPAHIDEHRQVFRVLREVEIFGIITIVIVLRFMRTMRINIIHRMVNTIRINNIFRLPPTNTIKATIRTIRRIRTSTCLSVPNRLNSLTVLIRRFTTSRTTRKIS